MDVAIISGRSGSGKSSAIHALEDLGFYSVDNLPVKLIPQLVDEFYQDASHHIKKLAVGIDARSLQTNAKYFDELLKHLKSKPDIRTQIFYCDADNDTLIRRFSETRRKHPMTSEQVSLTEALELERQILNPVIIDSTQMIDTTNLTLHELRSEFNRLVQLETPKMVLQIQSFGFKYGVPSNADLLFDVRCLQNPHWVPHLRPLTGRDQAVVEFLASDPLVLKMQKDILTFVEHWLPHYTINNRRYFTLSIGCTGGQHRSVFMAEALAKSIQTNCDILVRHRQLQHVDRRA